MRVVNPVLLVLLSSLILTGCATNKPVVGPGPKPVLVYPPIPYERLTCQGEPAVPDKGSSQEAFAIWAERVRRVGEECRGNLGVLREYILTWESEVDQSDIWVEEGDDY